MRAKNASRAVGGKGQHASTAPIAAVTSVVFCERIEPSAEEAADLEESRLVTQIQAGDTEAFAELYRRHFDRVYTYLRVVMNDRHEAEDTAQQVFMKVLEALPAYERRRQPFRAWLMTVVRNAAIDVMRRKGRVEPEAEEQLNRRREQDHNRDSGDADLAALDWVSDKDLVILLERMPLAQRQVLLLRYMMDLKPREVAEVLDRTPGDVRVLQYRALGFLRKRLTALGRAPERRTKARMRTCKRHAPVLRTRRFALIR